MNVKEFLKSDFLSVEEVIQNNIQEGVILDNGVSDKFGDTTYMKMKVQVITGIRLWRLNQKTIRNFMMAWGDESANWAGKRVTMIIQIGKTGKQMIVGYPYMPPPPPMPEVTQGTGVL